MVTAKVVVRTIGALTTCGISELMMDQLKTEHKNLPWPRTYGFSISQTITPRRLVYVVSGTHPAAVSRVMEWIQRDGHRVVERDQLSAIIDEQKIRLSQNPESMSDLLKVGRLIGADRIVFVNVTQQPGVRTVKDGYYQDRNGWLHRATRQLTAHYKSVQIQAVQVDNRMLLWNGEAYYDKPTDDDSEEPIQVLTGLALERATCRTEHGYTWMELRPWRKTWGCIAPERYPPPH